MNLLVLQHPCIFIHWFHKSLTMIRFIILVILLLLSSLTIFKAPTYHLWLIAITVTEFSALFCLLTLALIVSGFWIDDYRIAGTITGFIALLLYMSPIFRASLISKDLESGLSAEFGSSASPGESPFCFAWKVFISMEEIRWLKNR